MGSLLDVIYFKAQFDYPLQTKIAIPFDVDSFECSVFRAFREALTQGISYLRSQVMAYLLARNLYLGFLETAQKPESPIDYPIDEQNVTGCCLGLQKGIFGYFNFSLCDMTMIFYIPSSGNIQLSTGTELLVLVCPKPRGYKSLRRLCSLVRRHQRLSTISYVTGLPRRCCLIS